MDGSEAGGGRHGALVLHGITGTPSSMAGVAAALAGAGFVVESPLLPGHGTTVDDMAGTGWRDWSGAVEVAYTELAAHCRRVVVVGLSMGGTLACWLAARHPEVAGIVCVNPMVEPVAPSFLELLRQTLAAGVTVLPALGSDVARPGVADSAYPGLPVPPLLTLLEALPELARGLGDIRCPVLLLTSVKDHVVPPSSSDFLAARVAGPVERVRLEHSYHVATLDFDAEEIEARAVAFATAVTAPAPDLGSSRVRPHHP